MVCKWLYIGDIRLGPVLSSAAKPGPVMMKLQEHQCVGFPVVAALPGWYRRLPAGIGQNEAKETG